MEKRATDLNHMTIEELNGLMKGCRDAIAADAEMHVRDASKGITVVSHLDFGEEGEGKPN